MKNTDPLIDHLKALQATAPSISLLNLFEKSTNSGALATMALMLDTPKVSFKQGRCTYTVYNTWEHFDYLIRQHKRLRHKNYASFNLHSYDHRTSSTFDSAHELIREHVRHRPLKSHHTVKSPGNPKFRTRRQAEGGFTAQKKKAKVIERGTVLFSSSNLTKLTICTGRDKDGFTLITFDHFKNEHSFKFDKVGDFEVYIPKTPEWHIIGSFDTSQNLRLIRMHNPELYKTILKLKSQQALLRGRDEARMRRLAQEEADRKARIQKELEAKAEESPEAVAA